MWDAHFAAEVASTEQGHGDPVSGIAVDMG